MNEYSMESINKFMFQSPSTCLVTGPTSCGKTYLMLRILENRKNLFSQDVKRIIWCYTVYQDIFDKFRDIIEFHEGIYDVTGVSGGEHTVIIIDDLMHELNKNVAETFTVHSHHRNVTVFFITQNLFHKSKYMRDVSLNSHYIILFPQRRDISQIRTLAQQMFPREHDEFMTVYKEATSSKYGYLLCDLHPKNTHRVLLRTNIEVVYIPS